RRLVATTGETTRFAVTGHNITDTIDFDKNGGIAPLTFSTNRKGARVYFEIKYAGAYYRYDWRGEASVLDSGRGPGSVTLHWDGHRQDSNGEPSSSHGLMRNGPVEWTATVSPVDGVGWGTTLSGKSTITRKPHPHDLTDDGSPDLLMMSQYGDVHLQSSLYYPKHDDLSWENTAGVLWMYLGNGDGTFAPRVKLGGGWNEYTRIVSIGDLNYDGHGDLIAYPPGNVDILTAPSFTNGYVYWGTGDWRAPFKPRAADMVPGKGAKDVF
ncbi:FG-GAP repeat domain-containing protein, partial [Streptomyces flavochromogenes]|uniref:FG-GAP repeat domain-containing protein n=1 Tax=Streptomyces flavochromogenes TaxID=68199 RepID=UPI0004C1EBDF